MRQGASPDLLKEAASKHASRIAVRSKEGSWTYQDLDRTSDQISVALGGLLGTSPTRVGIFRFKDPFTVAAIYGILKAGGAYVPIDVRAPLHRILQIAEDPGLQGIVTSRQLAARLASTGWMDDCVSLFEG